MKQIEEVYWRDRPAEINYEAMYWTAQSEVARSTAEAVTLRADCNDLEADARELAVDNEALKAIAADLRKELAEAKDKNEELKELARFWIDACWKGDMKAMKAELNEAKATIS